MIPIIVTEETSSFNIGKQGDNLARGVKFAFLEDWREEFPGGYAALAVQRNGDSSPYLVPLVDDVWQVGSADTASPGYGQAEITFILNDVVMKSKRMSFYVVRSPFEAGDPPPEYQSWITATSGYAAEAWQAEQSAVAAAASAVTQAGLAAGSATAAAAAESAAEGYAADAESAKNTAIAAASAAASSEAAAAASEAAAEAAAAAAEAAAAAYPTVEAERVTGGVKVTTTDAEGSTEAMVYDGGVSSINGETGEVELFIPEKTSDLTNDSGFYSKPISGVPLSDLASGVRDSLSSADSALQDAPSDGSQYARKNGAWAVVEGGGGGASVFVVNIDSTLISGPTSDKTYAEIVAAISGYDIIVAKVTLLLNSEQLVLPFVQDTISPEDADQRCVVFAGIDASGGAVEYRINEDDSVSYELFDYQSRIEETGVLVSDGEEVFGVSLSDTISSASTDDEIPSAKAVYDAIPVSFVINATRALSIADPHYELDKSYDEINAAINAGVIPRLEMQNASGFAGTYFYAGKSLIIGATSKLYFVNVGVSPLTDAVSAHCVEISSGTRADDTFTHTVTKSTDLFAESDVSVPTCKAVINYINSRLGTSGGGGGAVQY